MFVSKKKYQAALDEIADLRDRLMSADARACALRANAFITNERGHRVRYADASIARRMKAEGLGK
ncbi:MAG: hypothetical protein A3E01_09040 [Gammaproteobacteria bacterium RIFCSPHIGHO2_12_FULL_63_22]|nr:MAG: hypothetical protein A3E01_09040 [Gammaproteobacteria bacterium RIFCSPHIGHO2_12_FULL_63_22]